MAHEILRDEKHGLLRKNTPYDRFKLLTELPYFKSAAEKAHKDLIAFKAGSAVSENAKDPALLDDICEDPRMESKSCIRVDSDSGELVDKEGHMDGVAGTVDLPIAESPVEPVKNSKEMENLPAQHVEK